MDLIVCGKNCEKWILEIAEKKDIRATLSGYDLNFEGQEIHALCRNDASEIHSYEDWVVKMSLFIGGADELEKARKSIIFIDEDVRYLYKKDFQTLLWKSDCYVVIISRSGRFSHLPFAINSIYELRTNPTGKMFMTQMYRIYKNQNAVVRATAAVVEDSNAGFEMMRKIPITEYLEVL